MSPTTTNVRVDLGARSYDIEIGQKCLTELGRFILDRGEVTHAVLITDENVQEPHAADAAEALSVAGVAVDMVVVPPGEPTKSVDMASGLWEGMLELKADRRSVVLAVGGGVVGDLAGFIAATYARGVRFFQVPTTLLAQVDSSVGGKVGINLPGAKNMVGAFLQPSGVFIDTATLDTLDVREYKAGLGEVVKYGVILDADFFRYLEANVEELRRRDHDVLARVVARCCRLKADVVERDEYETTGLRAILNYGHTFGHAFETLAGYGEILHGEAVAMGMRLAAALAARMELVDDGFVQRQQALMDALELQSEPPAFDAGAVLDAMRHDKKVAHGKLRFVLPHEIGKVELTPDVSEEAVQAIL